MVSIIGPLIGVIVGGLITYFITYAQFKHDKKIKDQELLLQRLEELNELIEDMSAVYNKLFGEALVHYKGGEKIQINVKKPMRLIRLKTLIYFYYTDLTQYIDLLEDTTEIIAISVIEMNNPNNDRKEKAFIMLIRTKDLFEKISKSITYKSSLIARKFIN
jgi:hypothetical protein